MRFEGLDGLDMEFVDYMSIDCYINTNKYMREDYYFWSINPEIKDKYNSIYDFITYNNDIDDMIFLPAVDSGMNTPTAVSAKCIVDIKNVLLNKLGALFVPGKDIGSFVKGIKPGVELLIVGYDDYKIVKGSTHFKKDKNYRGTLICKTVSEEINSGDDNVIYIPYKLFNLTKSETKTPDPELIGRWRAFATMSMLIDHERKDGKFKCELRSDDSHVYTNNNTIEIHGKVIDGFIPVKDVLQLLGYGITVKKRWFSKNRGTVYCTKFKNGKVISLELNDDNLIYTKDKILMCKFDNLISLFKITDYYGINFGNSVFCIMRR